MPESAHLIAVDPRYLVYLLFTLVTGLTLLNLKKRRQPRPRYIRVRRRGWDREIGRSD